MVMKKGLKIAGISIVLIIFALVATPFLFKNQIVSFVKLQMNQNLNAKVNFGDFSLSLFRSFPDFSFGIEDVKVIGVDKFEGDTLATIPQIQISLDLLNVLKGSYEAKTIKVESPRIMLIMLADSSANWDIAKPSKTPEATSTSDFNVSLQKLSIINARIEYKDALLGFYMLAEGMDHTLKGDFTAKSTTVSTLTTLKALTAEYGGVRYLNKATAEVSADIAADLEQFIFTISKNKTLINQLSLVAEGSFGMPAEGYDMDLTFKTPETDFKNLLSLVPAIYSKNFSSVKTAGTMSIEGFIKGHYSETSLPAFGINLEVDKASFQYPELPAAAQNIAASMVISNIGGSADNTEINLKQLHMELAGNPIDASLFVSTPISDPAIKANVKGRLDMSQIKKFYPLEQELSGVFEADLNLEGQMSAIEKQHFDDFKAIGSLKVTNLIKKATTTELELVVPEAVLNFSPAFLELAKLELKVGKTDFSAKGKVTNYLGFLLKKQVLSGSLTATSKNIDLNELMQNQASASAKSLPDSSKLQIVKVPAGIDFTMESSFDRVLYDKLEMKNLKGTVIIRDEAVLLKNLSMDALGGHMIVSGSYSTPQNAQAVSVFTLSMQKVNISKVTETFESVGNMVPMLKKLNGDVSAKMQLDSRLTNDMMPEISSLKSDGQLETSQILAQNLNVLDKLADVLKIDKLKKLQLAPAKLSYLVQDGKLMVKPFELKMGSYSAILGGSTGLQNQELDYTLDLKIPRSEFGGAANGVLNNLVSQANQKGANFSLGEMVPVTAIITGTAKDPKISAKLLQTAGGIGNELKKKAEEEFNRQKAELEAKAKAELDKQKTAVEAKAKEQADKLKAEAEKRKAALEAKAKAEADSLKKKAGDELKKKFKKFF
jgi:hypothetical protein